MCSQGCWCRDGSRPDVGGPAGEPIPRAANRRPCRVRTFAGPAVVFAGRSNGRSLPPGRTPYPRFKPKKWLNHSPELDPQIAPSIGEKPSLPRPAHLLPHRPNQGLRWYLQRGVS